MIKTAPLFQAGISGLPAIVSPDASPLRMPPEIRHGQHLPSSPEVPYPACHRQSRDCRGRSAPTDATSPAPGKKPESRSAPGSPGRRQVFSRTSWRQPQNGFPGFFDQHVILFLKTLPGTRNNARNHPARIEIPEGAGITEVGQFFIRENRRKRPAHHVIPIEHPMHFVLGKPRHHRNRNRLLKPEMHGKNGGGSGQSHDVLNHRVVHFPSTEKALRRTTEVR